MTITKGKLLELVLGILGVSTSILDITAEETGLFLNILNGTLAEPQYEGIGTWYTPDTDALSGDVADVLTLPNYALNALTASLAINSASLFNVVPTASIVRMAQHGRMVMFQANHVPLTNKTLPGTMPLGAGNKYYGTFVSDVN